MLFNTLYKILYINIQSIAFHIWIKGNRRIANVIFFVCDGKTRIAVNHFSNLLASVIGQGRAVATAWKSPGVESLLGRDFLHPSRPALEPTVSFPRGKNGQGVVLATHAPLAPRLKKE
jgi:hypothetical protein